MFETELIEVVRNHTLANGAVTPFSVQFPLGGFWTGIVMRFKHVLTNTTGTGAIVEGELGITKNVNFRTDKGEQICRQSPGRFLYRLDQLLNGTAGAKTAASATAGTFYTDIKIPFIDPTSKNPMETIFNSSAYRAVTLEIQQGTVADWLSTVGDSAITTTVDIYVERVKGALHGTANPKIYMEIATTAPINPSSQTFIDLERAQNLAYKKLLIFTTNSATAGVSHTGTATANVISEFNVENDNGFPYRTTLADLVNRRNKQDYAFEAVVTGQFVADFTRSGQLQSSLYSGKYAKLRINWTNDTPSASQVSCGYVGIRDLK